MQIHLAHLVRAIRQDLVVNMTAVLIVTEPARPPAITLELALEESGITSSFALFRFGQIKLLLNNMICGVVLQIVIQMRELIHALDIQHPENISARSLT